MAIRVVERRMLLSGFIQREVKTGKYLIIYLRICRFEKENNVIDSKAQRLLFAFSEHIARPRNRLTCLEAVFFDKSSWFQCRLRLVGSEMAPSFSSQRGVFWPAKRSNRIIMTRWV